MKSTKQLSKRAFSPIVQKAASPSVKNTEVSERKKKTTSTYHQIAYKPKQLDPYYKPDKKKTSNCLKDLLKQPQIANKYRIVTEPVDDRVIAIISTSYVPSKSKYKLDQQIPAPRVRQASLPKAEVICSNCHLYEAEITHLKTELSRIINQKSLWKSGQVHLQDVKAAWNLGSSKLKDKPVQIRSFESMLLEIKKHFHDLMRDIESLTEIDYPKMLSLNIFKYNPPIESSKNTEQIEIKSLLGQLRCHYEGRITPWDVEDQSEQSDHVKAILRNLRSRLSHYLRENLELKVRKAILEKADQISGESEEYLRVIIDDVLRSYCQKV